MSEKPEEKIRCELEFDQFLKRAAEWVDRQKEMLEVKPTSEQVEAVTRLYEEVVKKGKEFASCEYKGS